MATATLSWTPASGIKSQSVAVSVNGTAQPVAALSATAATYAFPVNPKDVVHAEVWDSDGFQDSAHATVDGTCPEFAPPAAPTGLTIAFAQ